MVGYSADVGGPVRRSDSRLTRLRRILAGPPPVAGDAAAITPIIPEYRLDIRPRYGHSQPPHPQLAELLDRHRAGYARLLTGFCAQIPLLARIEARPGAPGEPYWVNDWFTGLDAVALYSLLAERNPRIYLEVGSGCSTMFARRAIRDHQLRTAIISIDPAPRADIAAITDDLIQLPFQDVAASSLPRLGADDVLFIDGTHYVFSNTDTTAALLEAVPAAGPGALVHVHDVFLPWDYPPEWRDRYYNEQYLVAAYLLGGGLLEVLLANFVCSQDGELHAILEPLWRLLRPTGAPLRGLSLWLTRR